MQQSFQRKMSQQQHRRGLKQHLYSVVDDVEQVLDELPDTESDLKQRAAVQLLDVRQRLDEIRPLREAGQRAQQVVREYPWVTVGALAVAVGALLLGRSWRNERIYRRGNGGAAH